MLLIVDLRKGERLLPDYPKTKRYIVKKFNLTIQMESRNDPILSDIRVQEVHEGDSYKVTSVEGYTQEDIYKKLEAKFNLTSDEVITHGPEIYIAKAKEVAAELKKQETKNLFDTMSVRSRKKQAILLTQSRNPFRLKRF